jgi:circadian clock protein KaiC
MHVNAAEHSAEQFSRQVRREVEENDTKFVMIDGVEGFVASIQGTPEVLVPRLHTLAAYMRNVGVTTFFTAEVGAVAGRYQPTQRGASYLADNILYLGYFELGPTLNRTVGVLKKRAGDFDETMHEFSITDEGIVIGEVLEGLHGILGGTPEWYEEVPKLEDLDD